MLGLPVAPENGSVQWQNAVAIDRQRVALGVDEVRNHLLSMKPGAAKPEQLTVLTNHVLGSGRTEQ